MIDEIDSRRSTRKYAEDSVSLSELMQLVAVSWKAPSAGRTYPFDIYVIANRGDPQYPQGLYKCIKGIGLEFIKGTDGLDWAKISRQSFLQDAAIVFVLVANWDRIAKYKDKARRFGYMEAGHISQNIYLQAEAMGLGSCAVGVFSEKNMGAFLELTSGEAVYLHAVGHKEDRDDNLER